AGEREIAVEAITLLLRNVKVITQSDIQGQLFRDLEIVENVPGVIRPLVSDIRAVVEIADAGETQEKRGVAGAVSRADSRILSRSLREADLTGAADAIFAPVDAPEIVEAPLDAVLAPEPRHLLLDV